MRRGYDLRVTCAEDGCNEFRSYHYDTKKELNEAYIRHKGHKCLRHSKPNEVLGLKNKLIISEQICTGNYWGGKFGFTYGNKYRAYAKDFPEGTILKITAEIILPE